MAVGDNWMWRYRRCYKRRRISGGRCIGNLVCLSGSRKRRKRGETPGNSLAVQWFGFGSGWGPAFDPGSGNYDLSKLCGTARKKKIGRTRNQINSDRRERQKRESADGQKIERPRNRRAQ